MPKTLVFLSLLLSLTVRAEIHPEYFAKCDTAINEAIAKKECPGAVLLISDGDKTVYLKAYGNREVEPKIEPMTTDTIFDFASLSKVVGCAPSVMILVDRKKIDVHEKVVHYLPNFGQHGKDVITVEQLLLHVSGLIPDSPVSDFKGGRDAGFAAMDALTPKWKPGTHYAYSDVGFITLGRIVEAVSGQTLDQFAAENLFKPLGMTDTAYNPPASWQPRIAPTQQRNGHWMRGEVHDPLAYAIGGNAGDAGLFSTAEDAAKFIRMLLHGGEYNGHRILSEETAKTWLTVHEFPADEKTPDKTIMRTYGFDVDSPYAGPRGERFEKGKTFGHTGFTGTCFWVDPGHKCFYVLLTNSVHPAGKGDVRRVRKVIGTLAATALLGR